MVDDGAVFGLWSCVLREKGLGKAHLRGRRYRVADRRDRNPDIIEPPLVPAIPQSLPIPGIRDQGKTPPSDITGISTPELRVYCPFSVPGDRKSGSGLNPCQVPGPSRMIARAEVENVAGARAGVYSPELTPGGLVVGFLSLAGALFCYAWVLWSVLGFGWGLGWCRGDGMTPLWRGPRPGRGDGGDKEGWGDKVGWGR